MIDQATTIAGGQVDVVLNNGGGPPPLPFDELSQTGKVGMIIVLPVLVAKAFASYEGTTLGTSY